MSRILAREYAFKLIFQYLFSKDAQAQNVIDDELNLSSEEKDFSLELFSVATNNFDDISNKLAKNLKGKSLIDIYKLDYAIFVYAIACVDYLNESVGLAINQAVELAKKYSTDNSPKFVNGVLSYIYNN